MELVGNRAGRLMWLSDNNVRFLEFAVAVNNIFSGTN